MIFNFLNKIILIILLQFFCKILFAQNYADSINFLFQINSDLKSPTKISTDKFNNIFVTDINSNSVLKFDSSGNFLKNLLKSPEIISIASDKNTNLFVGLQGKILKIDNSEIVSEIYTSDFYPASIYADQNQKIYISDNKNKQISVINQNGNLLQTFGSGTLQFPSDITFDKNNSRIIVAEHGGTGTGFIPVCKVWIFNADGSLYKSFGSYGNKDGKFYRIDGVAVDDCGYIFVADSYLSRISVFNSEGVFQTKFGTYGNEPDQFVMPMDIEIGKNQNIIISSINNSQIKIFNTRHNLPVSQIPDSVIYICEGQQAQIPVELSGNAPWNFTYTINGQNPQTVSNINTSPYILSVSDSGIYEIIYIEDALNSGICNKGTTRVKISNQIPSAELVTPNSVFCEGQNTSILINLQGNMPYGVKYSVNDTILYEVNEININLYKINANIAGEYKITEISAAGCTQTYSDLIAVVNQIPLPDFYLGDDLFFCEGETQTIAVADNYKNYLWNTSDTVNFINVSETGNYFVTVTDQNNCTLSDTVSVTVYPLPTAQINNAETWICPGENILREVKFTGIAPWFFSYTKNAEQTVEINGITQGIFTLNLSEEGIYEITAVSDKHCTGNNFNGKIEITKEYIPVSDFSYIADNLSLKFTNKSISGNIFLWNFGDGFESVDENPVHQYLHEGEYTVSLRTENEYCSGFDIFSQPITVKSSEISDIPNDYQYKILPNPTNGIFYIQLNNTNENNLKIQISDISGKIIFSEIKNGRNINLSYDIKNYPNGIYFCRIISSELNICSKIILKK